MSFGGFGSGGGFGQQQQPASGGFGFGSTTNTGFGSTPSTGFGSTNTTTGGGLFGGGGTSGGFGGSTGGFGSTSGGAFGSKPAFGGTTTTTSGGLFGGGTATSGTSAFGGGGFGSNTTSASSPFGGGTSGGLFGAQKPAFGSTSTTQTNPFGGTSTSSPFGGGTTSAFGAPASSALGGGAGESTGTGNVPFQAFIEKEPNSTTNQQNSFQSISFQQPYQKFSPEELRLADYAQGRRYGNASGQAGAFGTSNFGGGFGSTNTTSGGFGSTSGGTGLFGGGATSSPFGTSQPAQTGGFGTTANSGGGLFGGASKPATTGLFGAPAAQSTGSNLFGSGGGFGTSSSTTGGFGQTNTTGGSLFGTSTANKPFSFGTSQPAASGSAFGTSNTATTGFGSGGGLFGNTSQQTNTGFGQQPAASSNPFGGFGSSTQQTGTSLFGGAASQPKPAATGLFGAAPTTTGTTGGLFGNTQQASTNNNPFGGSTTTQSGGLFGAKPATTGGLFGNTTQNQGAPTSGLFGGFGNTQSQPQTQQQSTGGLFGNLNNNPAKSSLFGNPTQPQGGSGLFGSTLTQQQGSSLFGGNNMQQQPQNSLIGGGNSLFGSQQGQPQALTTSITDNHAFGATSLFQDLGSANLNNPGPLATPLGSSLNRSPKRPAAIPITRLSAASSPRYSTPQRKGGFGFSYSTYASPSSVSSTSSTPGTFSNSTLGSLGSGLSSLPRALGRSLSTTNLRNSFSASDSILQPGAFSASPSARAYGSIGSVKRLTINRSIRPDLFSPPNPSNARISAPPASSALKKRVSFESNTAINGTNGQTTPPDEVSNVDPSPEQLGLLRPKSASNSTNRTDSAAIPSEQVKNNELAIVEEEPTGSNAPLPVIHSQKDQVPQEYWMEPSKQEIESMSRTQRQKVANFTVGRKGVGKVRFNPPVDLTSINLDTLCGGLIVLDIRLCTVYPNGTPKPARGSGLNVPSTISLENSWPRRGKDLHVSSAKMKKHIDGLKKVKDTNFVEYDKDTGIWTFTVEHFTTYGFPEDDEMDEDYDEFGQSTLSAPPDSPSPNKRTPATHQMDESFASTSQLSRTESDPDDTFQFRRKKVLPGAFDEQDMYLDEAENDYEEREESFLDDGSVGSQSEDGVEPMEQEDTPYDEESVGIMDQEMAGSYPHVGNTTELDGDSQDEEYGAVDGTPSALVRARMKGVKTKGTPHQSFVADNDWTNALRNTVSPKKQDRALLKSLADVKRVEVPDVDVPAARRVVSDGRGFANSIDLMNSLFGTTRSPVKQSKVPGKGKGFEWPYAKRSKPNDKEELEDNTSFRNQSMKPTWGIDGTLIYSAAPNAKPLGRASRRTRAKEGLLVVQKHTIVSERRDIVFAKFSNEAAGDLLSKQKTLTDINTQTGVPSASLQQSIRISDFIIEQTSRDPAANHERLVWQLASILFDEVQSPNELKDDAIEARLQRDKLSLFWQNIVAEAAAKNVALARSPEEKAIGFLSGFKVADACAQLLQGRDFNLATLVARIGTKESAKRDMREQLKDWGKTHVLAEFSQPVRAIYEMLAGNVCICDGTKESDIQDQIETFIISKRFGLDWRQSFGLRLWYSSPTHGAIDDAIKSFAEDLEQGKETARPIAWYVEQKVPALWADEARGQREDLIWGLLKLFAYPDTDLSTILSPENSQLSPVDFRLSWQLAQVLTATEVVRFKGDNEHIADQLTLAFAAQLTSEGNWLDAAFVLLHLVSETARLKSVQAHLAHHARHIGTEDDQTFKTLANDYHIPSQWIWEAKALYKRSVERDPRGEVECLVKAGSLNEAHRTFAREVAPTTVVEMDYDSLRTLLSGFNGKEHTISDWHLGGEIYHDFLKVVDFQKRTSAIDHTVIDRLLSGLPAITQKSRNPSFMEIVAAEIISGLVAKVVVIMVEKGEKTNASKLLRLPMTEDNYLKHTVELSLEYYRALVSNHR